MEPFAQRLVARLAQKMGLSRAQRDSVSIAFLLHDGRTIVDPPQADPLDPRTHTAMAAHVESGAQLAIWQGWSPEVAEVLRHHHEHFDGSGLPSGLSGDDIPPGSYVLAVANEFLRLSTGVNAGLSTSRALESMQRRSGTRFLPDAVRALAEAADEDPTIWPETGARIIKLVEMSGEVSGHSGEED